MRTIGKIMIVKTLEISIEYLTMLLIMRNVQIVFENHIMTFFMGFIILLIMNFLFVYFNKYGWSKFKVLPKTIYHKDFFDLPLRREKGLPCHEPILRTQTRLYLNHYYPKYEFDVVNVESLQQGQLLKLTWPLQLLQ